MKHATTPIRHLAVSTLAVCLSLYSIILPLRVAGRSGDRPALQSHGATALASPPAKRHAKAKQTEQATVLDNYGKLPLSFEPNQGQTDAAVKFLARGDGYTLWLTANEAVLALRQADAAKKQQALLRLKLLGANAQAHVEGQEQLEGKSNYLIGNDRSQWHTDIPTYRRAHYGEVWPGVDLLWYGNQRTLEYDFIVKPGADPSHIKLSFEGADKLRLDRAGNLVVKTKAGELIQHAPVIYQDGAQGRETIAGKYVLKSGGEVGFATGAYDVSRPLVIDPQLVYSTYLGSSGFDAVNGIAVDTGGFAYLTGITNSALFPQTNVVDPNADPGTTAAFVTKLNAAGTDKVYSTIFGGGSGFCYSDVCGTTPNGIAVTSDGKACITGGVVNDGNDSKFPVTPNAYQRKGGACVGDCEFIPVRQVDAFVTVLTPDGKNLFYSTFFGGTAVLPINSSRGVDVGRAIAVDPFSNIYITGSTASDNLPTKNAFQITRHSSLESPDAFIAVFNPALTNGNDTLLYASFLGGNGDDSGNGIAVDGSRNAYVVGSTASGDLATKAPANQALGPFQGNFQGGSSDAFIAKIDTESSGNASLTYLTYFGGNGTDRAEAVAVDSAQRVYITGATGSSSGSFPLLNAFDTTQSNGEPFVAKFNADGTALFYSSFLGGTNGTSGEGGFESGTGIATDSAGNAYVTGRTSAGATFPVGAVAPPFPANLQGTAFVAKIEASLSNSTTPKLLYSTTFGGNGAKAEAIALDLKGNVYLAGSTGNNLPTTTGAFQTAFNGGPLDGFVAKIGSTFNDTIGVFRPSANQFLLRNSNTTGNTDLLAAFGIAGDIPVVGDWDGDGVDDLGVFRPSAGQFLLRLPGTKLFGPTIITVNFGQTGDKPVVGDWNGDGIDTVGVFRNGTFRITNSPNINNSSPPADRVIPFGVGSDLPVAGDWDGDGRDTLGVYRVDTFLLSNNFSGTIDIVATLGSPGDLPVVGDWDGDGVDTIGIFRNGGFALRNSNTSGVGDLNPNFGQAGDLPLAGDWNGRPDASTAPGGGVNSPEEGDSHVGELQQFVTTCSDDDGWRDIHTIDFKLVRGKDQGQADLMMLWLQFDQNKNLVRFFDPDTGLWSVGTPGSDVVLSSRYAELHLDATSVHGFGPTAPTVQVMWAVVFKAPAVGGGYRQFLHIEDDFGLSAGTVEVGSWMVRP